MSLERRLPTSPRDGPYLQAALLCEKLLLEPDGTASAIRIIDNITVQRGPAAEASPYSPVAVVLPAVMQVNLLVILKAGAHPGRYVVQVVSRAPSGQQHPFTPEEVELPPLPHGGSTYVLQLNLALVEDGEPQIRRTGR